MDQQSSATLGWGGEVGVVSDIECVRMIYFLSGCKALSCQKSPSLPLPPPPTQPVHQPVPCIETRQTRAVVSDVRHQLDLYSLHEPAILLADVPGLSNLFYDIPRLCVCSEVMYHNYMYYSELTKWDSLVIWHPRVRWFAFWIRYPVQHNVPKVW